MAVRVDLLISLDGFATTTDQTPENPFGPDWSRLVAAYVATRTFRERVLKDTSGKGTTGLDDEYAKDYFTNIGAEIMGAGKFGLHNFPDDPDWKGWWGDEPPYHVPVFVLTQHARAPLTMAGGTEFHFVTEGIHAALERASAAAGGRDVRLGGGVSTVRQYLRAGMIDELHLAIRPVLLGSGEQLFNGIDMRAAGYYCTQSIAGERATHVFLRRRA
jgi:dihydrofolate reductase